LRNLSTRCELFIASKTPAPLIAFAGKPLT